MLGRLGISHQHEAAYLLLLDVNHMDAADLQACWPELRLDDAQLVLSSLAEIGFAAEAAPGKFAAIPPNVAIPSLIKAQEENARLVSSTIPDLLQRFWDGRRSNPGPDFIEIVTGRENIISRWIQLDTLAKDVIRAFDTPPYVTVPTTQNKFEMDGLARGVAYRIVYAQDAVNIPGRWPVLQEGFAAGEQARVASELPAKITLFDDWAALISLNAENDSAPATVMIIHPSPLLSVLQMLFETVWDRSSPLSTSTTIDNPTGLSKNTPQANDDELIQMLAAGLTDDQIRHALGVSASTIQRRIRQLQLAHASRTRYQMGYKLGILGQQAQETKKQK